MNAKTTRRALLSSVMALVLCVTMLMGTTFAWFTDTAKVNVNTITSGTLDVTLEASYDNGTTWTNVENTSLDFVKAAGVPKGEAILWEPGATYSLPLIRVVNNGNLALKYKIVISGLEGDSVLLEVIDWKLNGAALDSVADIELAPKTAGEALTLTGTMKTTANNDYQGKKLEGIAINVYATQAEEEFDSYNNTYDARADYEMSDVWDGTVGDAPEVEDGVATVTTAEELAGIVNALNSGDGTYKNATIKLDADLDLAGKEWTPIADKWPGGDGSILTGVVFDGNGKTIKNFTITGTSENKGAYGFFGYDVGASVIKNLNFENCVIDVTATNGGTYSGILVGKVHSNTVFENININNCVVKSKWQAGGIVGYAGDATLLTFKNCSVTNSFIGGVNCTSGPLFGCGTVAIEANNCTVSNVDVYTDYLIEKVAGYTYGSSVTLTDCTVENVNVVSAYPAD